MFVNILKIQNSEVQIFLLEVSAVPYKCQIANIILSHKGIVFPNKGLPLFNRTECTGEK